MARLSARQSRGHTQACSRIRLRRGYDAIHRIHKQHFISQYIPPYISWIGETTASSGPSAVKRRLQEMKVVWNRCNKAFDERLLILIGKEKHSFYTGVSLSRIGVLPSQTRLNLNCVFLFLVCKVEHPSPLSPHTGHHMLELCVRLPRSHATKRNRIRVWLLTSYWHGESAILNIISSICCIPTLHCLPLFM